MAVAVYKKIAAKISRKIDCGDLTPGSQIMSASQLCSYYDISHVTALKVFKELSSHGYVTASRGKGYFVSSYGRGSSSQKSGCIAVMMRPFREHSDTNNYFNNINLGISDECDKRRFNRINMHCCAALSNKHPEASALAEIKKVMLDLGKQVDGYIIDPRIPDDIIEEVRKATQKPMVLLQRESKLKVDCVLPEEFPAVEQMLNMLQRLKYENFIIGHSGGNELDPADRGTRFKQMLIEKGVNEDNIAEFSNYYIQARDKTMSDILKLCKNIDERKKTVIICGSDAIAQNVLEDLPGRYNLQVPGDIGLTGFGNYAFAKHKKQNLTGVEVHPKAIGELAVKTLLERIENGHYMPFAVHCPQSTFIIGDTI